MNIVFTILFILSVIFNILMGISYGVITGRYQIIKEENDKLMKDNSELSKNFFDLVGHIFKAIDDFKKGTTRRNADNIKSYKDYYNEEGEQ